MATAGNIVWYGGRISTVASPSAFLRNTVGAREVRAASHSTEHCYKLIHFCDDIASAVRYPNKAIREVAQTDFK